MDPLAEYVVKHVEQTNEPAADGLIDLMFFRCRIQGEPDKATFLELTKAHKGHHNEVNPVDGVEHGYIELGGWLGDQGLAMCYMALGSHLGCFKLMTPNSVMPFLDEATRNMLAGQGMITVVTMQPVTA